jgi:signal transduction histidine kinase
VTSPGCSDGCGEHSSALFLAWFDAGPAAFRLARDLTIVDANPALATLLGVRQESLRGRPLALALQVPSRSDLADVRDVAEGRCVRTAVRAQPVGGRGRATTYRVVVWRTAGPPESRAVVGVVTSDAAEDGAALEHAVDVVIHGVRNRIAGVSGALRIILDRVGRRSPEYSILEEIGRRLGSADHLVGQLFYLLDPPRANTAALSISQLLGSIARDLEPDLEGTTIAVPTAQLLVLGDERQLAALVRNAYVAVAECLTAPGCIAVSLSEEAQACVIQMAPSPPRRADPRETPATWAFGGSPKERALRLAVAERIAGAHGGSIAVEHHPSPGLDSITIRLPLAETRTSQ